jgi:hypothetical protein
LLSQTDKICQPSSSFLKLDVPLPAPHQLVLRLTTHGSARSTTIVNINLAIEPQQYAHNHTVYGAASKPRLTNATSSDFHTNATSSLLSHPKATPSHETTDILAKERSTVINIPIPATAQEKPNLTSRAAIHDGDSTIIFKCPYKQKGLRSLYTFFCIDYLPKLYTFQ